MEDYAEAEHVESPKKDTWRRKLSQNWGCSFRSLLGSNTCYVNNGARPLLDFVSQTAIVLEVFDLSLFEMIDCFPRP